MQGPKPIFRKKIKSLYNSNTYTSKVSGEISSVSLYIQHQYLEKYLKVCIGPMPILRKNRKNFNFLQDLNFELHLTLV
jgi:hypothetical protein